MERAPGCCTLASLVALLILVLLPERSWCKEETHRCLREAKPDGGLAEEPALKRFDDFDYGNFVGLMGRRSAAPPNSQGSTAASRRRHIDDVLAELLGLRTRPACLPAQRYLQTRAGRPVNGGRQRMRRFVTLDGY